MPKPESHRQLLALLDWYQSMGADAVLGDVPQDWLARGPSPPGASYAWPQRDGAAGHSVSPQECAAPASRPAGTPETKPRPRAATPLAPTEAETAARRIAREAASLEALEAALQAFEGCGLKATATKLCFYRGAPQAPLMIIGEAPGRDEDLAGKPFVGRAGKLLDKMLGAIGLGEADVHITNIVYWRPPGNRTPTPQESLACRPFLERQIALVGPKVVLALGGAAAKQLFDVADGIMRIRGKWRDLDAGGCRTQAMATLHPAYLLRTPAAKGMAWRDLLAVKAALK
jgi:DNA polymerase